MNTLFSHSPSSYPDHHCNFDLYVQPILAEKN